MSIKQVFFEHAYFFTINRTKKKAFGFLTKGLHAAFNLY